MAMGSLFSRKKKSDEHFAEDDVKKRKKGRVTAHDKAVLDLKVQRDKLKQYQKRVCALGAACSGSGLCGQGDEGGVSRVLGAVCR